MTACQKCNRELEHPDDSGGAPMFCSTGCHPAANIRVVAVHQDPSVVCPDCAGQTVQLDHGNKVQSVCLVHDATCPQQSGLDSLVEVLAVLTPPTLEPEPGSAA